jgi:regulator of cell morphogenesis and NO signaling
MIEITVKDHVGQLVAQDYRLASIFKEAGIDFCCGGNRSIETICTEQDINSENLIKALRSASEQDKPMVNYTGWPLDRLANYIERIHHRYVEQKTSEIKEHLNKIVLVHGQQHPELERIQELFLQASGELTLHMKKEELLLFPLIRKLMGAKKESQEQTALSHKISQSVAQMEREHEREGDRFKEISQLSNHYTVPEDACTTYRLTYTMLREFEDDLHLHIHLENNLLFQKAIAIGSK